jgi:predicted DNA-binding transcriptional regulator AlpA
MATRYIGIKEMCKLTGKSKPTLWRMYAKRKEFPAPEDPKRDFSRMERDGLRRLGGESKN